MSNIKATAIKAAVIVLGAVVLLLWGSSFVRAADQATPAISDVRAYRDLTQPGEFLVVLRYSLTLATTAEDTADQQYFFRLEYDDEQIGVNTPYPYFEGGFGEGVGSLYLTPEQTLALGWTDANGTWVEWGIEGITVALLGNPTVFTTPPTMTPVELSTGGFLSSGAFSTGSGQATNRSQLSDRVLAYAAELEQAGWPDLLNANGQLNETNGAQYFTLAIPGLRQMATEAFAVRTVSPTVPTPVSGPGNFASASADRFDGNLILGDPFVSLAATLSTPAQVITGFALLALWGMFAFQMGRRYGSTGLLGALILLPLAVVPVGLLAGWLDWRVFMLVLAMIVLAAVAKAVRDYAKG